MLVFLLVTWRPLKPPELHVALFAHVAGLGVLVQRVLGDLRAHLELVQFVSAVWQMAADARHFFTRKRIASSTDGMPSIGVPDAVIASELNGRHISGSVFGFAL